MKEFAGKTAVITGAASGIGLALAKRFSEEGMRLVLADIEEPALERARADLEKAGAGVVAKKTDVSRYEDVEALAELAYDRFGAVNLLCNNAGVGAGCALWSCTLEDWKWILGVNLWGVIHGVKAFVPRMIEQGERGHVLNTASVAGLVSGPQLGIYSTSKFGVVALSEALFYDLRMAGHDIGVSVLCPGFVRTRIAESERNRPPELSHSASPKWTSSDSARQVIAAGMDASKVASIVVDALREEKFYIFTHPWTHSLVKMRYESLLSERLDQLIMEAMTPDSRATHDGPGVVPL
ncbi:MAG: 3-oxoacyl-ACP reductase [Acidimicrobiia bacterium]